MELKELVNQTLAIFEISTVSELSSALYDTVIHNRTEKYISFKMMVGDLTVDWLQKIFQYYEADRKEKMQDYTPVSLARFCAKLTESDDETVVLDLCAGSGALTIQKWNENRKLRFVCAEYDNKVIPYLLFNLAIRNINAVVLHEDVLSGEVYKIYKITAGKDFSYVSDNGEDRYNDMCTSCVSNPPYNMKWSVPEFASLQYRFSMCDIPPANNANYAFVLTAIARVKDRAAMILPNGVLTTDSRAEKNIREYLIKGNFIEAVIACPDNMFEKTSLAVCILVFNKNKNTSKIAMVDMRQSYETEQRIQKGQFGGASHENRSYTKTVKVFTDDIMKKAIECIRDLKELPSFSKMVTIADVSKQDFILSPSRYIELTHMESNHREYSDIMKDINRIISEKNRCKLTINETIAKAIGLHDVWQKMKDGNKNTFDNLDLYKQIAGEGMIKENWIACTKNKGEFKFENADKNEISSILIMILQMWKQHIFYLNREENIYLAELRDALLPDLMNGKIMLE
jgi:type I restriction-modification system DNA methylase subunit